MTQITRDDVLGLARLSSLQLTDKEVETLTGEISNILSYVEQLGELDTEGVLPTYQVTGLENVWREDAVKQGVGAEQLVALAPEAQDNQIKVPKVL